MTVDVDKSEKLIRLLDTVVIKLEGGTEEDLKALDEPLPEEKISNEKIGKMFLHHSKLMIHLQYNFKKNPSC